jgi:hypothetical protein
MIVDIVWGKDSDPFLGQRAYYEREAAAQLDWRKDAGTKPVAGVEDLDSSLGVFIYDPQDLGKDAWHDFTEVPGTCVAVARHWVHCDAS